MAGWLALMLIVAIAGRETTRELNVFQIMEVRSVLGFFMLYPLIRLSGGFAAMKTSRPLQHIARNLIHYAAQLGWFFALTLIPLGQVVSIEFTMPIWTAILAASFSRRAHDDRGRFRRSCSASSASSSSFGPRPARSIRAS